MYERSEAEAKIHLGGCTSKLSFCASQENWTYPVSRKAKFAEHLFRALRCIEGNVYRETSRCASKDL